MFDDTFQKLRKIKLFLTKMLTIFHHLIAKSIWLEYIINFVYFPLSSLYCKCRNLNDSFLATEISYHVATSKSVYRSLQKTLLCIHCMLFKFFLTSLIFIPSVSDCGNEYYAKENKNYTGLKNFKQKKFKPRHIQSWNLKTTKKKKQANIHNLVECGVHLLHLCFGMP